MRIAIAACKTNPKLSASNKAFQAALEAARAQVRVLNWNEHPASDFLSCDLTVLRQTWDYQDDPGGFAAWLIRLHAQGARIEACPDLAIWNNDKRTLLDLEQAGIEIPLTFRSVEDAMAKRPDQVSPEKLVLKPAFGGDGIGVELATLADIETVASQVRQSLPGRPLMAQEFLPEISEGEWKMTCIEGKV